MKGKKIVTTKKYFSLDWYYWRQNFQNFYKYLKFIKNPEIGFYQQIIKNVKWIYKMNNIKLSHEFNDWQEKMNKYSQDECAFSNINEFIRAARNYTSHFFHKEHKYEENFRKSDKQISDIVSILLKNEYCKLAETKIFLLIYVSLIHTTSIFYYPKKVDTKNLKVKLIKNTNPDTFFPNIVASAMNLKNQYVEIITQNSQIKIKSLSQTTNYNITTNFIKNILVPLLNYYNDLNVNKIKLKFFAANEINYKNFRKIHKYQQDKIYYQINDNDQIKAISIRTFFKWYIQQFKQNNNTNYEGILSIEKIDYNSLYEFLNQRKQPLNQHNDNFKINHQTRQYKNYFNKEQCLSTDIHKLHKTLRFFVNKHSDAFKKVFDWIPNEQINGISRRLYQHFEEKNKNINNQINNIIIFLEEIFKDLETNNLIIGSKKGEFDKMINMLKIKDFERIGPNLKRILQSEQNITIRSENSLKKILASGKELIAFINYFIKDDKRIDYDSFLVSKHFLSKAEFINIIQKLNYSFVKETNYLSAYYKNVIRTIEELGLKELFDLFKLEQFIDKDNEEILEKLSELYNFEERRINTYGLKKHNKNSYDYSYQPYGEFKNKFCQLKQNQKKDKKFYNKHIETFYILFLMNDILNDKYKNSFKLAIPNSKEHIQITNCKTSKTDPKRLEGNFISTIIKIVLERNKNKKEIEYSDFMEQIEMTKNEINEKAKIIFDIEQKVIKKLKLDSEYEKNSNEKYDYIAFRTIIKQKDIFIDILKSTYPSLYKVVQSNIDKINDWRKYIMHFSDSKKDLEDNYDLFEKWKLNDKK